MAALSREVARLPIGSLRGCEDQFRQVIESGEISNLLADRVKTLAENEIESTARALRSVSRDLLVLHRDSNVIVSLKLYFRKSTPIHFRPCDAMYGVVGAGRLAVARFDVRHCCEEDAPDASATLKPASVGEVVAGEVLRKSANEALALTPCASAPVAVLRLVATRAPLYELTFDRTSLACRGVVSLDAAAASGSALADAAGALRLAGAAPTLRRLVETHPSHALRWRAVQNLARIDPVLANELLERLCDDPHPRIRVAAASHLERRRAAREAT